MHQDVNSNSRGSLLKEMEAETDSDVPEYSLPPKSIVKRPKKSIRKRTRSSWRKYCRKCCRYCSSVLLVLVLCACVLSIALLFWFSLRLYRDAENLSRRLTIEINRVQTEQVANVEKCTSLEKKMKENIKILQSGRKDIHNVKKQLQMSYSKIAVLNGTLLKIFHTLHSPKNMVSVSHTVHALQKGMADTGAEMTKLSDEIKQINKETSAQSTAIRRIFSEIYNISYELANITGKSLKTFHGSEDYLKQKFQDENNSNKENSNDDHSHRSFWKSDVYAVIDTLNNSLSAQVQDLQAETEALKMRSSLSTFNNDSVNISNEIIRIQTDMSAIQLLIEKLNKQVGNLTKSGHLNHIYENRHEIRLLWQELELQNETIVQIQQIIDQNMKHKSDVPFRHGDETETTQEPSLNDNFELYPEGTNEDIVPNAEHRRDTSKTRYRNLKSIADRFGDLEDNLT